MREIKFRAWDKNNEKMVYEGDVTSWHSERLTSGDLLNWFEDSDLMQYTGLKDKNGKEIYEGDIVHNFKDYKQNWRVDFEDGVYWLISDLTGKGNLMPSSGLEVIGNIYENPELINPKE